MGRTKLTVHILAAITQYERGLAKAAAACCLMRLSFASQNRLCRLPSATPTGQGRTGRSL
jgi:hypothetical protein